MFKNSAVRRGLAMPLPAKDAGRPGRENAIRCDFQLEAASLEAARLENQDLRARGPIKIAALELVALGLQSRHG
jgi:hypothetical protein